MRGRTLSDALRCLFIIIVVTALHLGTSGMGEAGAPVVSDQHISDAVEDELSMDEAVPSYKIDVQTTAGIVTLRGTLDNILAKERAARIAETVKGVRAVINEIQVVPSILRAGPDIENDVKDALLLNPATDSYEIGVQVKDGIVTLSGKVDSWKEREFCGDVAKGIQGVRELKNLITVEERRSRTDREIKSDIEEAVRWDVFVDHALIQVAVDNGKVKLSGIVGSAAEKSEAVLDAHVAGTKTVDSKQLIVGRWARDEDLRKDKYAVKSDDDIRAAVNDALLYDPRVESYNVNPEVSEGLVILRGKTDNLQAKQAAEEDAISTVGVRRVENRLKVKPEIKITDEKIRQRIQRAFSRHPYVDDAQIVVVVDTGIVTLYGKVHTFFARAEAEHLASAVNGVIAVDDNITVDENQRPYYYKPYVDKSYPHRRTWYPYKPGYTLKSDKEIKKDIEKQFFWSPFVNGDDINIEVRHGEATLTGTVASWSAYRAATENAYEGGAIWVFNQLDITPEEQ